MEEECDADGEHAWPVAGRQWCTPVAVSTSFALSLSRFESFSFLSLPFFSFLSLPFFSFFDFFDFLAASPAPCDAEERPRAISERVPALEVVFRQA